jgi:hypothetical protein
VNVAEKRRVFSFHLIQPADGDRNLHRTTWLNPESRNYIIFVLLILDLFNDDFSCQGYTASTWAAQGSFPRRGDGLENLFTNVISSHLNLFLLTDLEFS